jgi:hypothetical protein
MDKAAGIFHDLRFQSAVYASDFTGLVKCGYLTGRGGIATVYNILCHARKSRGNGEIGVIACRCDEYCVDEQVG